MSETVEVMTPATSSDPVADAVKLWKRYDEMMDRAQDRFGDFWEFVSGLSEDEKQQVEKQTGCDLPKLEGAT